MEIEREVEASGVAVGWRTGESCQLLLAFFVFCWSMLEPLR